MLYSDGNNNNYNRNNKWQHSICSSPCLDLIVIFGMFLLYLNSCMIFQLFGLFVLIEQWLRSLCILWSWAEYLDHLPRQLISLWSDSTFMVLVLVLVLYIGLVYWSCILWSWSWAEYLDHLARQLTPLWSDSSLMVARPPPATLPHPYKCNQCRKTLWQKCNTLVEK